MTWLGFLNFLVLQWFGVRLARCQTQIDNLNMHGFPSYRGQAIMLSDSNRQLRRVRVVHLTTTTLTVQWFSLLRWVWPLTGWWSNYRWIARRGPVS